MEKVLAAQKDCDIFDEIFSNQENVSCAFVRNNKPTASLAASVSSFSTNPFGVLLLGDLPDKKAMEIAVKLAKAIDKDSVNDIKYLKSKYGAEKDIR